MLLALFALVSLAALQAGAATENPDIAPARGTGISSFGIGATVPTVLGDNYLTFQRLGGVELEAGLQSDAHLGRAVSLRISGGFQPFKIRGIDSFKLQQWSGFVGAETRYDTIQSWPKPLASLELGGVFSRLTYTEAVNNPAANSKMAFALRFRPGVHLPFSRQLGMQLTTPLTVLFTKPNFVLLGAQLSLRFEP